jgi:uncharacterized protein (TIGR03643 family)
LINKYFEEDLVQNKIEKFYTNASCEDIDRVIRMCWEDRTPFEAIKFQFNLTSNDVVKFMRMALSLKDFKRWRVRANNSGHLKQLKTRPESVSRFKCSRQNLDGSTKGYK